MGFNLGEFLNLNNKKKLDESRGVRPASTATPKLTEQVYNQATDNYGRQLQQQVKSGQISNQDFAQKYSGALNAGQQQFHPAPFNPQIKAANDVVNVVKGTPASIWHTAALVPDAVRIGSAKIKNNPEAATNAVKDYNQNYQQSLPNSMIDPFARISDRISTGLPGGRNLQEASVNLESATSDSLRVATQAYKEGRISRDRYVQAYQEYQDAVNQAAQENARVDRNTSLKQGGADIVAVGSYALGGGKALAAGAEQAGAKGIVGKAMSQFAVPTFERNMPGVVDRALFSKAPGVVGAISTGTRLGATTGLVNSLAQDNVTPGSIAKGTFEGAANQALFGAGMYGAGKVIGKVTTGLVPNAIDKYRRATDIDAPGQDGYIQLPGRKQINEPLYHGSPTADEILKSGFKDTAPKPSESIADAYAKAYSGIKDTPSNVVLSGRTYGNGIYLTPDIARARAYGSVIESALPKNAKIYMPKDIIKEVFGRDTNYGQPNLITEKFKKLGYDGIKIGKNNNAEFVIFDPSMIKTRDHSSNYAQPSTEPPKPFQINNLLGAKIMADSIDVSNKDTFYHGTSKADAESLLKNGFNPKLSSKGKNAESPYALFASTDKGSTFGDHSAGNYGDGTVVHITPKSNAKLLDGQSKTWMETMGKSRGAKESAQWAKELQKRGYDGIKEANGEVTIFNHDKFNITKPAPQVGKTDPLEALKQEAKKYKSADEFVRKIGQDKDSDIQQLWHATSEKNMDAIEKSGYVAGLGGNSKGMTKGNGVWLYPKFDDAWKFSESNAPMFRDNPGVVTSGAITGKLKDLGEGKDIAAWAGDPKTVAQAKKEGYIGLRGKELISSSNSKGVNLGFKGKDTVFIFDGKDVKSRGQLIDTYNQAHAPQVGKTPKPILGKDLNKPTENELVTMYHATGNKAAGQIKKDGYIKGSDGTFGGKVVYLVDSKKLAKRYGEVVIEVKVPKSKLVDSNPPFPGSGEFEYTGSKLMLEKSSSQANNAKPILGKDLTKTLIATGKTVEPPVAPQVGKTEPQGTEKFAQDYLTNNKEKAMADYVARTKKDFGTTKDNIVAGDEVKHVVPGFGPDSSVTYHEPSSQFAKEHYKTLLDRKDTLNQPVLITGGGTGSGKTSSLKGTVKDISNYAAVIDTNLTDASSIASRVEPALASGRDVKIMFVYREPVEAYMNGVVPRALYPATGEAGRIVLPSTHGETHANSIKSIVDAAVKYQDNPKVDIRIIDNSLGQGKAEIKPVSFLKDMLYNKDRISADVIKELTILKQKGEITNEQYDQFTGKTQAEQGGLGTSLSQEPSRPQAPPKTSQVNKDLPIIGKKLEAPIKKDILKETMSQVEGSKVKKPIKADKTLLKSFKDSQAPDSFKEALGAFTHRDETYTQRPNKELWATAQQRVYEDPVAALDFYHNNTSDDAVAAGYALVNRYNKMGLSKEAGLLGADMAQRAIEAGRTTQAYALMKMMTPEGIVAHTERQIARYNEKNPKKPIEFNDTIKKDLQARITEVNKMPDGQARKVKIGQMQQVIDDLFPTSIGDKAITLWKAGLLTALRTHVRNIVGNTSNLSGELTSQAIGSPIDRLMSTRTGKRTNVATARGLGSGGKEGLIIGKDIVKTGVDTTGSADMKYNMHHTTWGKGVGGKIAKGYTDTVFRTLGAADKPFRQARQMNSMYSQGLAEAKNLGLTGLEKKTFIDKYVKDTNQTGINEGEISTFANSTGLGEAITKGKSALKQKNPAAGKAAEVVIPFSQVPAAVATQLVKYSPLGLAKGIYDVGKVMVTKNPELQRNASLAFGRGATGTAIMGAGALLMAKGLMTGDYPKDEKERAQWELERKQPNSVKVNGEWKSLNSVGPQTILLLAGAKAQQDHADGTSLKDSTINSAGYIGKQFNDQTFVKGLTSFTDAFTDPKKKLAPWLQGQATSVIPNIVKDVAKGTDPYQREVNSLGEKVKSSIPWASKHLETKKDIFGKDIPREGGLPGAMLDIFGSTTPQSTTTINELKRLQDAGFNSTPARIDKTATIGGKSVPFNSKQISELESSVGSIQKNAMVQLMNNENYSSLPDADKQNLMKDINSAIEPVENIRVAKKNGLLSDEQFNKAVSSLSKAQKDYLLNGNIQAILPDVKKSKEVDTNLTKAFSNSVNKDTTGLSVGKTATGNLSSADTKTYEEKLRTSQSSLDFSRALNNNDLNKYSTLTTSELLRLETLKKSYDPNTEQDKINAVTKQQEALSLKLSKYRSQGYIKKVAKATKSKVGTRKSYSNFSKVAGFKSLRGSNKNSYTRKRIKV